MKFKILGMALLAFAATSAFAVTNAMGTANGHFVHHNPNGESVWITGHESATTTHELTFYHLKPGTHEKDADPIHCETSTYVGTVPATTVTSIVLTPTYTNCTTESGTKLVAPGVHVNGCSYTFSSQGTRKHGTVNIDCPTKPIEITHPNCTIKIPGQTTAATLTEGISYKNEADGTITATVTVNTITGHYEAGLCVFLGTAQKFKMEGSVTIKGYEDLGGTHADPDEGEPVSITST